MRFIPRAAVLLLSAALTLGAAAAPGVSPGASFVPLQHPQPVRDPAVREVVEVFWYGCYHSQLLEQPLEAWAARQPSDVKLRRLPAVWPGLSDQTVERGHARLYFTLERLGEVDRLQLAVFHAVRDEGRDLTTEDAAATWAALQGVDTQRFRSAYESDQVAKEVEQAPADLARYETVELPSVVVQGAYRTGPTLAGSVQEMPGVIDDLLKQVQPAAKH